MKKRIFAVITLIALALFAGCKKKPEPEPVINDNTVYVSRDDLTSSPRANSYEVNPPFFRVTDENTGAVVYMLGSMHVGMPEAVYSEKLVSALDECDTLAVEVDIIKLENDLAAAVDAMQLLLCPPGKTVKDYMGDDYDRIVEKFTEKGLYNRVYEQYIPSMWSSLWSNQMAAESGYDGNYGTDRLLLSYSKGQGKRIDEIETAKEQYQVEADTSPELQMLTLNQTIELTDEEVKEQFDQLYGAWRAADMDTLKALASEEEEETGLTEQLMADYKQYYDDMYTNRQVKMADYVVNKLRTGGKTFVVVGAMHYAAPPSILDNLAEYGYTVEMLS